MRVALTGVPGTGKTTVARALAARGARIVHLNEFADERGLLGPADPTHHDAREVDLDALNEALVESLAGEKGVVIIEGHFAHEMDCDAIALLRVDPVVLLERLTARAWPESKVRENVEAEALDVLASEVMDTGVPAAEIDATTLSVEEVASQVWTIADKGPEALKTGTVGTAAWRLESLPWF